MCGALARIAPLRLAEAWDNVGLLVGDRTQPIRRVLTCLTITESVVQEAVADRADLVISHHPLPFKPLLKLTSDQVASSLLLRLTRAGTAIYSAHTAYDSAHQGINQLWAEKLQLVNIRPLVDSSGDRSPDESGPMNSPAESDAQVGSGRYGDLATEVTVSKLVRLAAAISSSVTPRFVGDPHQIVKRVAIACGSGGGFLAAAKRHGCDVMITGEATFHVCLEAEGMGVALGLMGHYASERFAMETLAAQLNESLPELRVWASQRERDPIHLLPAIDPSP